MFGLTEQRISGYGLPDGKVQAVNSPRQNRPMSARERELIKRCIVLFAGVVFFSFMAAYRAFSGDYYSRSQDYPYYDDEYDVMSDEDHLLSRRLQQRIVGQQPVYFRRKASKVHDSVTIIVNENTASEITTSNELERDTSANMTLTNWITPSLKQRGQAAGGNTPTFGWTGNRAHNSDSTIDRAQTFTSTLTGKVLFVQPNGYLVVEAKKSVHVNGEIQTVTVTGIVNPDHMDADSNVRAEYLIDMAVSFDGKGPMSRMNKRGWWGKAFDFFNPF